MAGPYVVRKIKSLFNRNKKSASPDLEKIIPPGNFPVPESTPIMNTNYKKEWYRAIAISNMERQMKISKYLKQEGRERSTSESDSQDMKATQGKEPEAMGDGTKD